MPAFDSDGISIAYDDIAGDNGRPMILVHGFSSNRNENWRRLSWYGAFERKRIRMVAMDCRGHGESGKPHEAHAYGRSNMAGDVRRLADHLGIERFHLMGYSMGARIALAAALDMPERIATLTLGGIGEKLLDPPQSAGNPMAAAMEAEDPESVGEPMRSFRRFADEQGEDRHALAALTKAGDPPFDKVAISTLSVPVLVLGGVHDELAGDPEPLAAMFPDGRAVVLPGCDHFSAIPHALYKATVFDFLDGTLP